MKKTIIFGIGELASQVYRHMVMDNQDFVVAFTAEKRYCTIKTMFGIPVVPFESLKEQYTSEKYDILICVGYNQMNSIRKRIFDLVRESGYSIASYIHKTATVLTEDIGVGNIILEM